MTPHYEAEPWRSLVAQGDPRGDGWTGHLLPGSIPWFVDDSTPPAGGNTQILVTRPGDSITLFEGEPMLEAIVTGPNAPVLQVTLRLVCYLAVAVRRAGGTAVVGGAAYPTTLR